jgi:lipopolysaccharide biosynthesis regulator YciM
MAFDLRWLLLVIPIAFALGWWASRLDLRQAKRDPRDAPQSYFKGLNLLLNEQHDKAIDAFIEAVQHDPDTAELHFALGNLFRRRGETERAVRVHEHLLARGDLPSAERDRAQHALAQDFFKAGLFDRAEAAYRALAGTAHALDAELALLSLYERSRDWARAGEVAASLEARGAGSFAMRRAQYLCEQALSAHAQGQASEAQSLLTQAQTLAPSHARARVLQGQWALQAGHAAAALQAFDDLRAANPQAFALVAGAYAYAALQLDRLEPAAEALAQHYAAEPALALLLALNRLSPERAAERLATHLQGQPSLNAARHLLALQGEPVAPGVMRAIDTAAKPLLRHRCAACGFEAAHYFWQCPGCLSWDSFPPRPVEEL